MDSTSVSLLKRLRSEPSEAAWEHFVRQYRPLLLYWARRLGLQHEDAADLVQEVLVVMVRKLPQFQYHPEQSFRGWMRTILINKWRDRRARRLAVPLEEGERHPASCDTEGLEEREHRHHVLGEARRLAAAAFEPATCRAFWETVVAGRPAAQVAETLGISVNAVYVARSRVLRRLRHDLQALRA
jgi:RNA polymerase sigma-70 factor (ECF subfamily)